jgi:ssDNA-binding replication factor A large subunit
LKIVSICLDREHDAGSNRLAVEQNCTRAADTVLAPDVGTCQCQILADEIAQQQARLDVALVTNTVDRDANGNRGAHGMPG